MRQEGKHRRALKRGTSFRHGLTGAFTLARSLLPSEKPAHTETTTRAQARKRPANTRRDDHPLSAPTAVADTAVVVVGVVARGVNDISKSSVLRIRDTFASGSHHLRGVYCERDKGDLSVLAEGAWK